MISEVAPINRQKTPSIEYLALVEELEQETGSDDQVLIVDAVPRRQLKDLRTWSRSAEGELPMAPLLLQTTAKVARRYVERGWVVIRVSAGPQSGAEAEFEASSVVFDRDGDDNGLRLWCSQSSSEPSRSERATLRRLAEIRSVQDGISGAAFSLPHSFLGIDEPAAAMAVYDVGQASFGALVNPVEHPIMFLDLGWPLPAKRKSVPANPSFNPLGFPTASHAPVVLTHLDWDHWGFAIESGRARWDGGKRCWSSTPTYRADAMQRPWILRRPRFRRHRLGPSHIHFLHALRTTMVDGRRALNFYPTKLHSLKFGAVMLIRCDTQGGGSAFLRNNEGLAVFVQGVAPHKALYCGDAEFASIPKKYRQSLTGVAAPHHGGAIDVAHIPSAPTGGGVMAVSTFAGCYSNVPSPTVRASAEARNWQWLETSTRAPCVRSGGVDGHLMIPLMSKLPLCGCGEAERNGACLS